jgi:hypothetical protein
VSYPVVTVEEEWRRRAEALARRPYNLSYASSYENLYVGLLAELAVVHYLIQQVADIPAIWLSPNAHIRKPTGGHRADIAWNGLELDVKLIARNSDAVKIKRNAQGFHHVFVDWQYRMEAFRILGVLTPYPPETFGPTVVLPGHHNKRTGAVNGWLVPVKRLQPLDVLIRKESA